MGVFDDIQNELFDLGVGGNELISVPEVQIESSGLPREIKLRGEASADFQAGLQAGLETADPERPNITAIESAQPLSTDFIAGLVAGRKIGAGDEDEHLEFKVELRRPPGPDDEDEDLPLTIPDPSKPLSPGALEETWWLLNEEGSNLADVMERAGDSLNEMFDKYKIRPINIDGEKLLFLARFDIPQYDQEVQHADAKLIDECLGVIDFLCGFPLQNQELLAFVGELSSKNDQIEVMKATKNDPVPPIPKDFFDGYEKQRLLMNYFYLDQEGVETMADDMKGEPVPKGLHWWTRINLNKEAKFPVPGEFTALIARQWCTLPWGEQENNPYMFAGNWIDTVYLTGAKIKSIDDSGEFPKYTVTWRNADYEVRATDFAQYKEGDRVTILKNVGSDKQSQLWRDDDSLNFDTDNWVIAPLIFYGIRGNDQEDFT